MNYDIKETHVIFDAKGIKEIAVLWDDNGNFRATYATTEQKAGYDNIKPNDALTSDLLQRVAGFGMYLTNQKKKDYFPNVTNWSR